MKRPRFKKGDRVYYMDDQEVKSDTVEFSIVSIDRWGNSPVHIEYALTKSYGDSRHNPSTVRESALANSPRQLARQIFRQAQALKNMYGYDN